MQNLKPAYNAMPSHMLPSRFSVLVDAKTDSYPVICATKGFYEFTGYAPVDVLGKTSIFLHGMGSDKSTLAAIGDAMHDGEAKSASILNYKKDGTPFFNYVSVRPVRDAEGSLYRFSNCQTPICEHLAHLQTVFGFSLIEMHLAEMLCKGATLQEVAESFGLLRQAVRLHILSIATKTGISFGDIRGVLTKIGTKRQRELIAELNEAFNDAQALVSSIRPNAIAGEMLEVDRHGNRADNTVVDFGWMSEIAGRRNAPASEWDDLGQRALAM